MTRTRWIAVVMAVLVLGGGALALRPDESPSGTDASRGSAGQADGAGGTGASGGTDGPGGADGGPTSTDGDEDPATGATTKPGGARDPKCRAVPRSEVEGYIRTAMRGGRRVIEGPVLGSANVVDEVLPPESLPDSVVGAWVEIIAINVDGTVIVLAHGFPDGLYSSLDAISARSTGIPVNEGYLGTVGDHEAVALARSCVT